MHCSLWPTKCGGWAFRSPSLTPAAALPRSTTRRSAATRRAWIVELDRIHPPLIQPGVGTIHYGALPAARAFTGLALLQGAMFVCLVILAVWAMRERVSAARDRLWVAMARESAHQLGTPLMSLTGWIDRKSTRLN